MRAAPTLFAILSLIATAALADNTPVAADARVLPPVQRAFRSASGKFELTVISRDNWKTPHATAELAEIAGADRRVVWRRILPHEDGPRLAMVADSGAVALFDEWINVPSHHALMLIGPNDAMLADYSFDRLVAALGVPRRAVAVNAKQGPWLSGMPVFGRGETELEFRAGGRGLTLKMADGRLSVTD